MDFSIRDESTFYNFSSLPTKMCIFIFGFTHTHIRHVYNETSYRFLVVVNGGYLSTFWCWVIQRSRGGVKVPEFSDSFRLYFCYILLIFDMLVKILLFPAYSFGYEMCWRMSINEASLWETSFYWQIFRGIREISKTNLGLIWL